MTRKLKALGLVAVLASQAAMFAACNEGGTIGTVNPYGGDGGLDGSETVDASLDTSNSQEAAAPYDAGPASYNFWSPGEGPIVYWGGPIIQTPNIYLIWYGGWVQANPRSQVIEDMVSHFGGTEYSNIMKGYWQVASPMEPSDAGYDAGVDDAGNIILPQPVDGGPNKVYVSGGFRFAMSDYVGYTHGTTLHAGDARKVVQDELDNGDLPVDPYGVYFVLTSADVDETMDDSYFLCGDYCGYHDTMAYHGSNLAYSVVGDPSKCISNCTALGALGYYSQDAGGPPSPNGDWGVDGMATVLIHELCEATSDPIPNYPGAAWQDQYMSSEIGDMCAWRFEPTYVTPGGARANVHWGDRDYLIQQMWVNDDDGGRCDLQP